MVNPMRSLGGAARRSVAIMRETVVQFVAERAPRMAAALAFYTAFSLAPLLLFAVAIAGIAFGQDAAEGRIVGEIQGLVGVPGALTIQELIDNARKPFAGTLAAVLGVITLLFGVTGLVGELQDSLNLIWNVKPDPAGGLMAMVKRRLSAFALVVAIGFLLIVSLLLSTMLSALTAYLAQRLEIADPIVYVGDIVLSFLVISLLFALLYKSVPDVAIGWRDVWWGAAAASLLFAIGKFGLGYYLAHSSVA